MDEILDENNNDKCDDIPCDHGDEEAKLSLEGHAACSRYVLG